MACLCYNKMSGNWLFAPFYDKNQYTLTICPLRTVRAFELFTDLRKDRAHYNDIEKSNHYYFIVFSHQKAKTWKSTRMSWLMEDIEWKHNRCYWFKTIQYQMDFDIKRAEDFNWHSLYTCKLIQLLTIYWMLLFK